MEVKDINKKVTDKIYCVCICNVCDSIQGYYTDIEEAKARAQHEYELLNKNKCVDVQEMVWNESEKEEVRKKC